ASSQPFSYEVNFNSAGQLADPDAFTAIASTPADPDLDAPAVTGENGTLSFAAADWTPAEPDPAVPGTMVANGAANSAIVFDMRGSSQYASSFGVNSLSQDGYTTGLLAGLEIDDSGVIFARYTN